MKYTVIYIEAAMKDIAEITEYLSRFYPDTPLRFQRAVKKAIENLIDNPFMYAEYPENPKYRRIVVNDYLIFYKVIEASGVVEVHRVLYGMRDIAAHLSKH